MTALILGRLGGFAERRAARRARRARRAHQRDYHRMTDGQRARYRENARRVARPDPEATAPMPVVTRPDARTT